MSDSGLEVIEMSDNLEEGPSTENQSLLQEDWKLSIDTFKAKQKSPEDLKKMKGKMAKFYNKQNELVDSFVTANGLSGGDVQSQLDHQTKVNAEEQGHERKSLIAMKISLIANVILLGLKAYAAGSSLSLSVFASLLDSFLDILSNVLIMITAYLKGKPDRHYRYPSGKSRFEPLGLVIFAAAMFSLSIELVIRSAEALISGSSDTDIGPLNMSFMGVTVVSKFILYIYCRTINTLSAGAMAIDHLNDVMSNVVGIATAMLGYYVFWWIDPAGAIAISFYIMINWLGNGYEQVKYLAGKAADPEFLQQLTFLCWNHDAKIIAIDTVKAFYFGEKFLVEVDIVLPEDMELKEAHEIGESLQDKLECLSEVERAFVHLDYEVGHMPEHNPKRRLAKPRSPRIPRTSTQRSADQSLTETSAFV